MFKYFRNFPTTSYKFVNNGSNKVVTDILKRVKIRDEVKNNIGVYTKTILQSGETPESLASKAYGDSGLHWIILMMNDITNPIYDWLMDPEPLQSFITGKYGAGNENATHHWENARLFEVNSTEPGALIVTNYEFEDRENEKKRDIKVLDPEFVSEIVKEFKTVINQWV